MSFKTTLTPKEIQECRKRVSKDCINETPTYREDSLNTSLTEQQKTECKNSLKTTPGTNPTISVNGKNVPCYLTPWELILKKSAEYKDKFISPR